MKNKPSSARRFVDDYLSYLLGRAAHAVYMDFHATVRDAGFSALEWRVMAQLSGTDGLTIGELAREALAQQPTLTKLIQRMEKLGWVTRHADAQDARRTLVYETPAGRAAVAKLLAAAKHHEERVLAPFSAAEAAALKKSLRAMIAAGDDVN
jgi:MarR family transcriptional regulator, organic hydroperoxide resistance regulator